MAAEPQAVGLRSAPVPLGPEAGGGPQQTAAPLDSTSEPPQFLSTAQPDVPLSVKPDS